MNVVCRACGARYRISDDLQGKRFHCKHCPAIIDTSSAEAALPDEKDAAVDISSVPSESQKTVKIAAPVSEDGSVSSSSIPVAAPINDDEPEPVYERSGAVTPEVNYAPVAPVEQEPAANDDADTKRKRGTSTIIPETHELIRDEDIEETLEHLSDKTNTALPQFTPEHITWIRAALMERKSLCAKQYHKNGSVDEKATARLKELDAQINGVSVEILKVLHFLSRIRAIIPALLKLQEEVRFEDPDPTMQMIKKMKYDCSKAEVQSAISGLSELHIRPKVLDDLAQGKTPGQ